MRSTLTRSAGFALLMAVPTSAMLAQGPLGYLAGAFANITDVNGGFVFGSLMMTRPVIGDSGSYGLRGLAFEVSFGLGNFVSWGPTCPEGPDPPKQIERHLRTINGRDSVEIIEPAPKTPCNRNGIAGEVGLGYAQIGRFRGQTVSASGAIEELPFLTLYGSVETDSKFTPYGGVRAGLVQLKDLKTTVDNVGAKGTGSTFEYGTVVGLGLAVGSKGVLFAEFAWTYRTFDGIDWAPAEVAVPAALLTPLNLDTRTITIGIQLEFKKGS